MKNKKILSFNSNKYHNHFLSFLKTKNFNLTAINNKAKYKNINSLEEYSIILFDSRLEWDNKIEILDWIRDKNFRIPVIIFFNSGNLDLDNYYRYCISEYIDFSVSKLEFYKYFKKALRDKDKMYLHYYHIAEMYHLQSNYEEAKNLYRYSIKINKKFINSYISLFYIHIRLKEIAKANQIYKKIVDINPPSFILLNLKIYLEYLQKNYSQVINLVNRMERNEQVYDSKVYKYQLDSYFKLKKWGDALKGFLKFWYRQVNFKSAFINTIKMHKNLNNYNSLYRASKNAKDIFPQSDFVNRSYMLSLFHRGKVNKINSFIKTREKYKRYFSRLMKKD